MKAITLIKYSFDNLENRDGLITTTIGVFFSDSNCSAHGKIEDWFRRQPAEQRYLGWNGVVYPVYKLQETTTF